MRIALISTLAAFGFVLAGMSGASAGTANGGAIRGALDAQTLIQQAQYYYHPRRRHCRSVRVCNRWGRCWWERRCWR